MSKDKDIYDALCDLAAKQMPGFKVAYKDESWLMKLLGFASKLWCPDYMTNYTTTLGMTVYFPNRKFVTDGYGQAWKILAHELTHGMDYRKRPVRFVFGYAAPQILGVLALAAVGAFWSRWFLFSLLFLAALAPWPSPGRVKWELRGYAMSMAVNFWRYGGILPSTKQWVIDDPMTGWGYYRMCWSKKKAEALVDDAADRIAEGSVLLEASPNTYLLVYNLLKSLNAVTR